MHRFFVYNKRITQLFMSDLSPSYDNKIERKYSMKTLDQKSRNKTALQRELGWPAEQKMAVLCIPQVMTAKGFDLLSLLLPGIDSLNVQLLVLNEGPSAFLKMAEEWAKKHKHRVALLPNDDEHMRKMLAAADISLFINDAEDSEELRNCLRYGTVPVCPENAVTENYNLVQESGNAFTYEDMTVWHCFAAVVRALETFKFPYDWRTIQRHCMEKDKSSSADEGDEAESDDE